MNSILADEMGLGKTVMSIAMLDDIIKKSGVRGPFMVIAPLSTLANWQREINNWTDVCPITFHGVQTARDVIKKYEIFYDPPREKVPKVQVLLTTMETVYKEIGLIRAIHWHFVIIDEAHRLKNLKSKHYQMMNSLQMEHILLLTGTPIQNNIDEIFALLHFIAPRTSPRSRSSEASTTTERRQRISATSRTP
jgi:SNF2 family DNA or RNA helicase